MSEIMDNQQSGENFHREDIGEEYKDPALIQGHPINVLVRENKKISHIVENEINPYLTLEKMGKEEELKKLEEGVKKLKDLFIHYRKNEKLFFPYMKEWGLFAAAGTMQEANEEIEDQVEILVEELENKTLDNEILMEHVRGLLDKITEIKLKEENTMVPMLLEHLTKEEWKDIADGSLEIGYMLEHVEKWKINNLE